MRLHIDLDENLLQEVQKLGHFTTKNYNLRITEYAKLLKRQQLLALRGKSKMGRGSKNFTPE